MYTDKPEVQFGMDVAISEALFGIVHMEGGPFGACILSDSNKLVASSHNTVIKDNDPTAHGEMNAIREACKRMESYNLIGCKLFTTAFPCPMCMAAAKWANINTIYYGCTAVETDRLGFQDDKMTGGSHLTYGVELIQIYHEKCENIFKLYNILDHQLY